MYKFSLFKHSGPCYNYIYLEALDSVPDNWGVSGQNPHKVSYMTQQINKENCQ